MIDLTHSHILISKVLKQVISELCSGYIWAVDPCKEVVEKVCDKLRPLNVHMVLPFHQPVVKPWVAFVHLTTVGRWDYLCPVLSIVPAVQWVLATWTICWKISGSNLAPSSASTSRWGQEICSAASSWSVWVQLTSLMLVFYNISQCPENRKIGHNVYTLSEICDLKIVMKKTFKSQCHSSVGSPHTQILYKWNFQIVKYQGEHIHRWYL